LRGLAATTPLLCFIGLAERGQPVHVTPSHQRVPWPTAARTCPVARGAQVVQQGRPFVLLRPPHVRRGVWLSGFSHKCQGGGRFFTNLTCAPRRGGEIESLFSA
jgi:hypothetical protein